MKTLELLDDNVIKLYLDGKELLFDLEDWIYLYNNCTLRKVCKDGYVRVYYKKEKQTVYFHRIIMNAQENEQVDHINRNPLDNRRCNLRTTTRSSNLCNSPGHLHAIRKKTSKYKGVSWNKGAHKWLVVISHEGKTKNLGYYLDEDLAAQVYNRYVDLYRDEHAFRNKIED